MLTRMSEMMNWVIFLHIVKSGAEPSEKRIFDGGHIKVRKFFFYEGSVKVQEVIDDGSERDFLNLTNVSMRQIKTFVPVTLGAFIGFPKEVREECLEIQTGSIHLQKKTYFC